MSVKIYSRQYCPYCVRAERLLNDLSVRYEKVSIDGSRELHEEMQRLSGRSTVPQIWIGDRHIGGCDELIALHRSGQLTPLLADLGRE